MKKTLILILLTSTFFVCFSQMNYNKTEVLNSKLKYTKKIFDKYTIKFDTDKYPSLSSFDNFEWSIPKGYSKSYNLKSSKNSYITSQTWEAARFLQLKNEVWQSEIAPMSHILYPEGTGKIFCYAKNIFSVVDKKGNKVFEKNFNPESSNYRKITSVTYNKKTNKVFYAISEFDDYCESKYWEIASIELSTNKITQLTHNESIKFENSGSKKSGDCPFFLHISVSPDSRSVALNYTNLEFQNYCYNVMILNDKSMVSIDESCDAKLLSLNFINNNSLIYIVQNHKTGNLQVKSTDLTGKIIAVDGCFIETGIKGKFIDMELLPDSETFLLYYFSNGKNLIEEYNYAGKLISKKEVGAFYRLDLKTMNYFTAYNYNILNERNLSDNESKGAVFHQNDILDYSYSKDRKELYTVSEDGVLKKWTNNNDNLYLLILENNDHVLPLPVELKQSENEVAKWLKDTEADFTKFIDDQREKDALRRIMEDDYIRIFELNKMNIYTSKVADEKNKNFYAKFEIPANKTSFPVKVFHIIQKKGKYYVVQYCGACVNDFAFNPKDKNILLAILPNDKIGILNNSDFKNLKTDANKIVSIKLKVKPISDTEKIVKEILEQ